MASAHEDTRVDHAEIERRRSREQSEEAQNEQVEGDEDYDEEEEVDEVEEQPLARTTFRAISPKLPEIASGELDFDLTSILGSSHVDEAKIQKRASNVMKLSEENEKLKAELKAMTDRLEAAERKREELALRQEKRMKATS